jgi:hypothetical protein
MGGLAEQLGGSLVALVAIVLIFGTPIILVVSILYYRIRRARLQHQTILSMIEKGLPVPPELISPPRKPGSDLRTGIILIAAGVGLTVFFAATAGAEGGAWGIGTIPLLIGVGFVIAGKLEARERKQQPSQ